MILRIAATLVLAAASAAAQSTDLSSPPKILQIQIEILKPGRAGAIHEKSESAFTRAQKAARSSVYYLGMNSLSGPSRAIFLAGYDSMAAYEKENAAIAANPTLGAALDKAFLNDGDLLTSYETNLYLFRPDLSLEGTRPLTSDRYFEISRYQIKPGHNAEFEQMAGIYKDGFKKANPGTEFVVYESQYGKANGGVFIVLIPYKSLSESDDIMNNMPKMAQAEGKATMAKLDALYASAVDSYQTNLFQFAPTISYLPASWAAADSFWKPRPTPAKKTP